jgi:uncharacterized protein Yka (UPF0111/DUF47 family)
MTMPDQSLSRRQATGELMPQGSPGSPEQLTEEQLRAAGSVTVTTIVEMRDLYGQVEVLMEQGKRSDQHQKWLLSRTANALHTYEVAADAIQRRAIAEIIANRPPEVVTRIIEVPKKGILPRLFGK